MSDYDFAIYFDEKDPKDVLKDKLRDIEEFIEASKGLKFEVIYS